MRVCRRYALYYIPHSVLLCLVYVGGIRFVLVSESAHYLCIMQITNNGSPKQWERLGIGMRIGGEWQFELTKIYK